MKEDKDTELRRNLPSYATRVGRGKRARVSSRGKVIAELTPPAASKKEVEAARVRLRGSVLRYDRPLDPVIDPQEWDANR